MEFVDVSQFKIVKMSRFSTFKIRFDGDAYLDSPISESADFLRRLLRCTFKTPSVLYKVVVTLKEPTFADFELICENLVAAIFTDNMVHTTKRDDNEKRLLLNKLPSGRWTLKKQFADRVHCDVTTLLRVADYGWRNRNLNILIETSDGAYKYELIGAEEA